MKTITLTRGFVALVDDDDYERLSLQKWRAVKYGHVWYAIHGNHHKKDEFMHRVIMNAAPSQIIDHWNGDGLDNQRGNLRFADDSINQQNRHRLTTNTSGYRGVTFHKQCNKWQAGIKKFGKTYHLGLHVTKEEAARAYDEGARRIYGPMARTNFPKETTA